MPGGAHRQELRGHRLPVHVQAPAAAAKSLAGCRITHLRRYPISQRASSFIVRASICKAGQGIDVFLYTRTRQVIDAFDEKFSVNQLS